MGYFDYSREPKSDIAFVDMKSFMPVLSAWKGAYIRWKPRFVSWVARIIPTGLILASLSPHV